MLGPPGTLNTITPCAACKLLRRRCAQECPFSPYFSPHEPQKFASVHKVFGASNVSKMLMVLKILKKKEKKKKTCVSHFLCFSLFTAKNVANRNGSSFFRCIIRRCRRVKELTRRTASSTRQT